MSSVKNIRVGSTDTEYNKKVQQALVDKGYDIGSAGVDGKIGPKTDAAIRAFQSDKKIKVDGIAGKDTQSLLFSTDGGTNNAGNAKPAATGKDAAPAATPVTSPGGITTGDFIYPDRTKTDDEIQAEALLAQNNANRPGAWTDPYLSQYMGYLNQYENRDPFSYDFNSDALYQQYKDNYIQQGQMAMMDTMGQAAAMTGGYGNSYAQTVGQQVYNQQLSQLNDIMPELYGMAYDRYQQEGQEMLNMYGIYKGLSDQSFDRYQGELDNWYREDARLTDNYNTIYNRNNDEYLLGYNTAWDEYLTGRNEKFTTEENEKSREFTKEENDKSRAETQQSNAKSDLVQLITSTGYKPTDAELKAAGMSRDQANGYAKAYSDSLVAANGNKYSSLDTEQTLTWRKLYSGATSLTDIEDLTTLLEGIIGPEEAAKWYNLYAPKFRDEEKPPVTPTGVGGSGGGGRMLMSVK